MATRPNYNAANRKVYDALDDRDKSLALALATSVYAQAIFFDCNVREQFIDDRPQKTESTDTYDLYRAVSRKDKLFDWTRFVEWREIKAQDGTIAKTDGEADTVKGKMINLYSQNTNTYVSLDKQSDVRQIGATYNFKVANDGSNNDVDTVVWRGAIVEYKSGTDKEHLLGLRTHHHREQDKLYLLLAHFKATGAALLFAACEIDEDEDYNKTCADTEYDVSYYDQAEDKVKDGEDEVPAGFKKTREHFLVDVATDWAHGSYHADRLAPEPAFFAGTGTTDANMEEFYTADLPTTVKAE